MACLPTSSKPKCGCHSSQHAPLHALPPRFPAFPNPKPKLQAYDLVLWGDSLTADMCDCLADLQTNLPQCQILCCRHTTLCSGATR